MRFQFSNIGMIKEAELKLDNITVITGENDSGKSTIGKLLYAIYNASNNLERVLEDDKKEKIREKIKILLDILKTNKNEEVIFNYGESDEKIEFKKSETAIGIGEMDFLISRGNFSIFEEFAEKISEYLSEEERKYLQEIEKIRSYNVVTTEIQNIGFIQSLRAEFKDQITNIYSDVEAKVNIILENEANLSIILDKHKIISIDIIKFPKNKIMYIDSPFMIRQQHPFPYFLQERILNHVQNFDKFIYNEFVEPNGKSIIEEAIENKKQIEMATFVSEVMGGEYRYSKKYRNFVLEKNGKEIISSNLATGIKSLSLIFLLLKADFFKKDNILILDEPEVYLHPKWQILYAKLLVTISKEFGTKIILTSHSPFFIEGIERYSKKIGMKEKTNFYFMEKDGNTASTRLVNDELGFMYEKLGEAYEDLDDDTLGDA